MMVAMIATSLFFVTHLTLGNRKIIYYLLVILGAQQEVL